MVQICEKNKCYGCSACFSICGRNAIEMKKDEYGFLYPEINQELCIDCGLCKNACPVLAESNLQMPLKTYAAITKNENDYKNAASGGVSTAFARAVIAKGGVVYGAAVCEGAEIRHIRVSTMEGVERLKGSKYVQSEIGDTYKEAKKDLISGKRVLFAGTSCQIVGLYTFLEKEYPNLLTVNLICHGVPSYKMLREHLQKENGEKAFDTLLFRDKQGWNLTAIKDNHVVYKKNNFLDVWYLSFFKSLCYRENCYTCKFATEKRVGDFTIGDFWGYDKTKGRFPVKTQHGLSVILVNNDKATKFFGECKESFIYMERELQEAVDGNKQLRFPSVRHRNNRKFKKLYLKYGFDKAAKKCLWLERIVYWCLDKRR